MCPFGIVPSDPLVKVVLKLFDGSVHLLSERDKEKLVLHGLVETFTDTVGLRALCLGPGMVDVLNGQVKLIFVVLPFSTVLGSPVGPFCWKKGITLSLRRSAAVMAFFRS